MRVCSIRVSYSAVPGFCFVRRDDGAGQDSWTSRSTWMPRSLSLMGCVFYPPFVILFERNNIITIELMMTAEYKQNNKQLRPRFTFDRSEDILLEDSTRPFSSLFFFFMNEIFFRAGNTSMIGAHHFLPSSIVSFFFPSKAHAPTDNRLQIRRSFVPITYSKWIKKDYWDGNFILLDIFEVNLLR